MKPKQLDLALEEIESIRHLAGALEQTVSDLAKRIAPETREISSRIVLQHCERALRIARGAPMNPQSRARIDATYKMVQRELAA
jgi:hypothetical protein